MQKVDEMSTEGDGDHDDKWKKTMKYVAEEIVKAATAIAKDPYAESPYMERALEEGMLRIVTKRSRRDKIWY
jgi:hypothetical protein